MRRTISTHRLLTAAIVAMGVGVAFELGQALSGVGGSTLNALADTYVYTAVELIAVAVCATRAIKRPQDRVAWALMTIALIAWTAGDLVWTVWLDNVSSPPYPSIADAFYLTMYPAIYIALMLLTRSRLRIAGAAHWLDGGVVGLTVAAVAAALVFDSVLATSPDQLVPASVTIAYPVGDFVLLMCVAVAYSLSGWRPGRGWLLLGAGIVVVAVADIIFTYQTANGTYVAGGPLDAMWPASIGLLAVAAWAPIRGADREAVDAPHTIVLTLLAATSAMALLVVAAFESITPLAVGFAAAALVLASVRAALTYQENVRILRARAREALTDSLSGLGNRRSLMADLEHALNSDGGGHPLTVLFFDLNGFKHYNDSFGHAAGDALLARIGTGLRASIGDHGRAYRLGGDEFCVLLDGRYDRHDMPVAAAAAALVEHGSGFTVSSSVGLAVMPDDATTATAALQLADERMYSDKASRSSAGRAQAHDVLMQLLNERALGMHDRLVGVGTLAAAVGTRLELGAEQLDELQRAAELHDIGKLAIPDEILNKPGPLSESEWRFIRHHPVIGERILGAAPALRPVAKLVRCSHERWDGRGYPDGISGIKIPLGARIIAVCDAYQAMIAQRGYRRARTEQEAIDELRRCAGTQFDPRVVDAACAVLENSTDVAYTARYVAPVINRHGVAADVELRP